MTLKKWIIAGFALGMIGFGISMKSNTQEVSVVKDVESSRTLACVPCSSK
ncbi:MAG: hypothetical protein AB8E15_09515 [Bdellovibrionales bacterium]